MKNITTGILAHVDAGKTTCVESLLYEAGVLRSIGRVDHQDSFLDYDPVERERGITIYSKQAALEFEDMHLDILDTPGHADFSSEMERVLSVLDAAIVLISGLDSVQSHTRTIWKLLDHYQIPALVFLNKMDITTRSYEELKSSVESLPGSFVNLEDEDALEQLAQCDDQLLEEYFETGTLRPESISRAFMERKFFPVLSGSALKSQGTRRILETLNRLVPAREWPESFGARVYKVEAENNKTKVYARITGGSLQVKDPVGDYKADSLFQISGQSRKAVSSVQAGQTVEISGLQEIRPGDGLGFEQSLEGSVLESCLSYELVLP